MNKLRELKLDRRGSLLVTVVVLLLAATYCFYLAAQMPASLLPGYPGDGFFPRITLMVILICGAVILVRELVFPAVNRTQKSESVGSEDASGDDASRVVKLDIIEAVSILVLGIGYMILLPVFGMEIMTTIFMFILFVPRLLMPLPRAIIVALLSAVLTTVFVYFAFAIGLRVPLPLAFLPRYLGQF